MHKEYTYQLPENLGILKLDSSVIDQFIQFQQKGLFSKEAGGQLFCSFDCNNIHILFASGPTKGDIRSRFGFKPNRKKEQAEIDDKFKKENLHFIGDWHTHPEGIPSPSSSDIVSITNVLKKSQHTLPGLILIIVGNTSLPQGLYVSFHTATGGTKLDPIQINE